MSTLTRRRLLTISAAALALPGRAALAAEARWQGQALGAHASLHIRHLSQAEAAPVLAEVEAELARLEAIFSLYRSDSALVRLNRRGRLDLPPPELLEVLTLARTAHAMTGGLFDPSVQPLFAAYAEAGAAGRPCSGAALERACGLTGFGRVAFDAEAIRLEPGMALTLNGIAQGFITDRIAGLLRARGLGEVLVDMGEIAALGTGWRVGIAGTARCVTLDNHAIATSAALGTVLDAGGRIGHIFHPGSGWAEPARAQASVIADSAALADALSTAAVLMPEAALRALEGDDIRVLTV